VFDEAVVTPAARFSSHTHTHTHTSLMSEVRAFAFGLTWRNIVVSKRRHGKAICFVSVRIERRLASVANAMSALHNECVVFLPDRKLHVEAYYWKGASQLRHVFCTQGVKRVDKVFVLNLGKRINKICDKYCRRYVPCYCNS
jgi:hypothetical protein